MRVFITGMSGTLGTALARLHHERGDQVWGCSRSEVTAVPWLRDHGKIATLYLSNASNLNQPNTDIARLLPSIDRVYHCAAMKHVDLCENQPLEAVKQNVEVTQAVAIACQIAGVPLVFVSSDKACSPQGVYGATKLLAECIAIRHLATAVRLVNLIGSSGSVFQLWKEQAARGEALTVTDPNMTRYFMTVRQAAEFLINLPPYNGVVVPHPCRAVWMGQAAKALAGDNVEVIGLRPGETKHQWLIAPESRVRRVPGALVLDEEGEPSEGESSFMAQRWDVNELLAEAGR